MDLSIYHKGKNYKCIIKDFEYLPGKGDIHTWESPDDAPGYILDYEVFNSKGEEVNIDLSSEIIDILT